MNETTIQKLRYPFIVWKALTLFSLLCDLITFLGNAGLVAYGGLSAANYLARSPGESLTRLQFIQGEISLLYSMANCFLYYLILGRVITLLTLSARQISEELHKISRLFFVIFALDVISTLATLFGWYTFDNLDTAIKLVRHPLLGKGFLVLGFLSPPTTFGISDLLIGYMLVMLSKAIQEYLDIRQESDLTI